MGWSSWDGNKDGEIEGAGMHTDGVHVVMRALTHSEVGVLDSQSWLSFVGWVCCWVLNHCSSGFFSSVSATKTNIVKFQFDQVMSVSPNSRVLVPGYKMWDYNKVNIYLYNLSSYRATDVNPFAAKCTLQTAKENGVSINCVITDLVSYIFIELYWCNELFYTNMHLSILSCQGGERSGNFIPSLGFAVKFMNNSQIPCICLPVSCLSPPPPPPPHPPKTHCLTLIVA